MTELVIGADGFIGQRLQQLSKAEGTSRRNPLFLPNSYYLELDRFSDGDLPDADLIYLCAGINGAMKCEGNKDAFRVNVDSTIRIAQHYTPKSFLVWISSMSSEWANTAYARQKAYAECALRLMPNVGIVRAGRVTKDNLDDLCKTLIKVGREKIEGITLWGSDDTYRK